MQKLILGILLTCCFVSLEAREKQQPYIFSQEKILKSFFEELFEKTTLGYVIYGQKPVEITRSAYLDKTIPETIEHFSTLKMFMGLETLNIIPSYSTKNKYSFIQISKNEPASSSQKILLSTNHLNFPYQKTSLPKNEKEVKKQLKNSSSTKKGWAKLKEDTKDCSYYRKTSSDEEEKVFLEFKRLLYRK